MTQETKSPDVGPPWAGRLATLLIVVFVGVVLTLMFFAVRGPR